MRPDFATEKYAPTLDKLAHDGVRSRNHHAVYPTATDVNGVALATGCYPNRNGLAANLEFRPAINSRQPIDMGDQIQSNAGTKSPGANISPRQHSWNHCAPRERRSSWWERNRSRCFLIATTTGPWSE